MNNRKAYLLIFSILLTSCSATKNRIKVIESQNVLDIWTEQTSVQAAYDFEMSLGIKNELIDQSVGLSKGVYPNLLKYKIAQPIIVKRDMGDNLPIYAEYFFSEEDSILRYVSYDWEKEKYGNLFEKEVIWKKEANKLELYNNQYEEIKSQLIETFGQPSKQDTQPQTTKSQWSNEDYLSRNTIWETNEIHANLNMVFAANTYRIRLNYYWLE